MRNLQTRDIAPAIRLIEAMNIKDKIAELGKSIDDVESFGNQIIWLILTNYANNKKAEYAFVDFLSGPFEMSAEEVLHLDVDVLADGILNKIGINKLINFFKMLR